MVHGGKKLVLQEITDKKLGELLFFDSLHQCDAMLNRADGYTSKVIREERLLVKNDDSEVPRVFFVRTRGQERIMDTETAINIYEINFNQANQTSRGVVVHYSRSMRMSERKHIDRDYIKQVLGMANVVVNSFNEFEDDDPILCELRRALGMSDQEIERIIVHYGQIKKKKTINKL